MFKKFTTTALLLTIILSVSGCGASLGVQSGVEPTETLDLDGEFEFSVALEKGDVLGLDMRRPVKSGYRIVGASFDPSLFRLEHYLEYGDDGEARAQYVFTLLADCASDVLIKMEPVGGGNTEIYKRVTIFVGEDDGLF